MKRKDGERVKKANPMYTVVPYIMDKRYDAMNMIELFIPVEPLQRYRAALREKSLAISNMALVLTSYLKAMEEFPLLNRFIVNKRIYQRNENTVGMVVLKPGAGDSDGSMHKMWFGDKVDIFSVQKTIDEYVSENRQEGDNNSTDDLITKLLSIPGLVNVGVGMFKFLDKHNLLPKKIIDASPFHVSLVISNLASIRTNHIYHHCYEFGTTSMILTMGNLREVPVRKKGEIVFETCLPLGVVMDERICAGSYYAKAFQRMRTLLADPTLMEPQAT